MITRKFAITAIVLAVIMVACGNGDPETVDDSVDDVNDVDEADDVDEEPSDQTEEAADDETYELLAASYLPQGGPIGEALDWWAAEVEDRSGGRIQTSVEHAGSLYGGPDVRDAVADGRADVGLTSPSTFHVEDFPLTDALTLVPGVENPVAFGAAIHELYHDNDDTRSEWENQGIVGLGWFPLTPIIATNVPIEEPNDLSGLTIRGNPGGGINALLDIAGATSSSMPAVEMYQGIEQGIIDGSWTTGMDVAVSLSLQEVTSHWTDPQTGVHGTATFFMNLETFETLPDDLQDIVIEVGRDSQDRYAELVSETILAACDPADEEGVTLSAMDDTSETEQWKQEAFERMLPQWQEIAEEAGVDPEAYYDEFLTVYNDWADRVSATSMLDCF